MFLSLVSGLVIRQLLKRKNTSTQIPKVSIFKWLLIPVGVFSFLSAFLIIGYYQIVIFYCNSYIPLSYPFEITNCIDNMPTDPTIFDFYFKHFGYRIFLFELAAYSTWDIIASLFFLGFFLFVLNYLSTCLVLVCIEEILQNQ